MKEKYNELFSAVKPQTDDKALLNAVVAQAQQEKSAVKKHIFQRVAFVPAVALLIVSIAAISVGAVYGGIQYLKTSKYGQNEEVAQSIQSFVFSDSSKHINMTVEELLSDGQKTIAVVHYEALTDEGKVWLEEREFSVDTIVSSQLEADALGIMPLDFLVHTAFTHTTDEISETNAEGRYYRLLFMQNGRDTGEMELEFNYGMLNDDGESVALSEILNVDCGIEPLRFEICDAENIGEHVQPIYIELTNLTFGIYGVTDIYGGDNGDTFNVDTDTADAVYDMVSDKLIGAELVMADGNKIGFNNFTMMYQLTEESNSKNLNCNVSISSGDYGDEIIDPDDVIGLELGGIYYELVPIE